MTLYNATYRPGELAGAINNSPHVNYYMIGYAGLTAMLMLTGLCKSTFPEGRDAPKKMHRSVT